MRTVFANIKNEKGKLNRYFAKCVGAGRAAEVMRHAAYAQLCEIQKECPFEYVRFHGLFHDEMAIVHRDKQGCLQFNFQYVDILFDSLLDINIRPVVELGLMPEEMAEKNEYVFWWRMNISSAKSMDEWYSLVEAFVRHVTERYGEEEVKKWYFEVWNEPNLSSFFTENKNKDAYFELYDNAARAVKSVCEDYSVGGPVTAGSYWVDEMIAHCRECKVPLDFISTHEYCVHGYFDSDGESQVTLLPTSRLIERVCEVGTRCRKEGLPLLLTEWSTSYTSRDPIHDSYISAPFILEALKGCDGAADMMSYWVYTDIFEEVSPPYGMFHGGFGLMTVQSVKKPSYYAYRFLAALGDTEIVCADESCYVCKNEDEIQVLLWNYKKHEQGEESNSSYYSKDIPSKSIESVKLELCGLEPNAPYSISIETIGYKMGDCYGAYLEMGAPKELTREETESLKERSKPKLALVSVCSDKNGGLELEIPQTENQADLVRIAKKK